MTDEDQRRNDDYDGAWKSVLDRLTEPFLALLFPAVHALIDWRVPPEQLDTELQQVIAGGKGRKRAVDRLIKLRRLSGGDCWLLLHVEVQAQQDHNGPGEESFARRMYRYHYRIDDREGRPPISLAVLADDSPSWRPDSYRHGECGCEVTMTFPIVKLRDLDPTELEASANPFADVVLVHRRVQRTRGDTTRAELMQRIGSRLLRRGFTEGVTMAILEFADRVMALPPELKARCREAFSREAEELGMPYLNWWEQHGMERGLKEGEAKGKRDAVLQALEARFGAAPEAVVAAVQAVEDLARLDSLHRLAVVAKSLADFEKVLLPTT